MVNHIRIASSRNPLTEQRTEKIEKITLYCQSCLRPSPRQTISIIRILLVWFSITHCVTLNAHGGVALADDVCVMSLGNLSAHFAIYQPKTRQSREFCEDIPDASESLFVIDFIHDVLGTMEVEFRIIRDVANTQLSTTWEDVLAIDDLESATLFYSEPQRYASGSMKLRYHFEDKGYYVGIINATNSSGKEFRAVFPFRVGGQTFWTYFPFFVGVLLLLELFFWMSRDKRGVKHNDKNNENQHQAIGVRG